MLIRIKSDSLLKIYTADSICMETDAMFGNLSANTQEFLNTAVRLLAFLHKNEISTDDIYGEIAGDEESAVLCARELGKAGLFYIEKYKPQYVCSIRDDFLKDRAAFREAVGPYVLALLQKDSSHPNVFFNAESCDFD